MICPRPEDWVYGFAEEPAEHVATCGRCRKAAERLTAERELLARAVASLEIQRRRVRLPWAGVAAAILVCVGVLIYVSRPKPHADFPPPPMSAERILGSVSAQAGYRVRFTSRLEAAGSDPIEMRGECVWIKPSTILSDYTERGSRRRIIRMGESMWAYHEALGGWVAAEEMGVKSVGLADADRVLAIIRRRASPDRMSFGLHAMDLAALLPGLEIPADAFSLVELEERDGRLHRVVLTAEARPWTYRAEIEFVKPREMDFGVPLPEFLRQK